MICSEKQSPDRNGNGQDRPDTCPICSGEEFIFFDRSRDHVSNTNFTIWTCTTCRIGLTHPHPDHIYDYYPSEYRCFIPLVSGLLQAMYRRRVRTWLKHLKPAGRAFEIGCGNGWMLKTLREYGWTVVGFERDEVQADQVRCDTGLEVLSGNLYNLETDKFDLILLFNAIEHLTDPVGVLRHCMELLNADGIVVISTQNYNSMQSSMTKGKWFHLDVPRHLYHFSADAFTYLFDFVGMEVVNTSHVSWIHDPIGWIISLQNMMGFKPNRLHTDLSGKNISRFASLSGLLLAASSAILFLPAVALSLYSWAIRSGAMVEIWGRRID